MKSFMLTAAAALLLSSQAHAFLEGGYYYHQGQLIYANGANEYCTAPGRVPSRYVPTAEYSQVVSMYYQGYCSAYTRGSKNYRGQTYYSNGQGGYCVFNWFNPSAYDMSSSEAQQLFRMPGGNLCQGG